MFIYNVTTKIHTSIHEPWVLWMKEKHIPEIMATGCFTEYRFVRLLEIDDSEGPTYAVQFFAKQLADYHRYISSFAPALRNDSQNHWGDHSIGFRSLMAVVH